MLMAVENAQARLGAGGERYSRFLTAFFCWAVVILTMPAVNCGLVHRGPGFEAVFVGGFLAVFWSVLTAVLLRKKAPMWVVVLVQILVLVVSLDVCSGLIPEEVSKIDSDGHGLMNSLTHGGEMAMVVMMGVIMRLTWWRLP